LLDVGEKRGVVERAVEDRRGRQAVGGQRRHDRVEVPLPVARSRSVVTPHSSRKTYVQEENALGFLPLLSALINLRLTAASGIAAVRNEAVRAREAASSLLAKPANAQ